jgi:hypothetical protein
MFIFVNLLVRLYEPSRSGDITQAYILCYNITRRFALIKRKTVAIKHDFVLHNMEFISLNLS